MAEIALRVNGEEHRLAVDVRTTLLDLLRENVGLTGAKKGCDHGQCGACTILLDGRRANACLALAVAHDGAELVTVEGLAAGDDLHPLQAAFVEHDAFQCGYCTPGQLCSAVGMLAEAEADGVALDAAEIRERMSGNLCRCGAYPNIVAAIVDVASVKAASPTSARPTPTPPSAAARRRRDLSRRRDEPRRPDEARRRDAGAARRRLAPPA